MKDISNQTKIEKLYEQVETEVFINDYKAREHEKILSKDPSFEDLKKELIDKRGESYFDVLMLKEADIETLRRAVRTTRLKEYMSIESKNYPNYDIDVPEGKILLFHNTTGENAESIAFEGLKKDAGSKQGRGLDGDFVWGTTKKNLKGYGGYTVAFMVDADKAKPYKVNDTEYTLPFDIPADDIVFIDEPIGLNNYRESDIKALIDQYGEDRVAEVLSNKTNFDSDAIGTMISKSLDESEDVTREILHKNPVELSVYYKDSYGNDRHSSYNFDNVRALFKYVKECGGFKSAFDGMMYFIKSNYNGGEYYLVRDRFSKEGWKWQDCNGRDLPNQFKSFKSRNIDLGEKVTTYVVDFNKLLEIDPDLEYELESRSGDENYGKIYKKFIKSISNKIRLNVYEMDLIAYIYEDTDNIDAINEILYRGLVRSQQKGESSKTLTEANLLDLINDSKATDPKRIKLASTIYTDYKGVDSDGTLLFESDSQTRSGLVHRQRVFYPGFFDLLDTVDAGDEITEEQMVEIITNDLMVDCSCFTGETLISTVEGFKYIRDIKVGDEVLTHTGQYKKVVKVFDPYESDIIKVSVGTRDLYCTPNHPFLTLEGEWVPAEQCVDKTVVCYEVASNVISPIGTPVITKLEEKATVYNFEVADDNSYCVGQNRVIVHNCESFLYYAWAYKSWRDDYGLMKELREPKRNNIDLKGGACKHVLSVLDLLNRSNTLFEQVTKDLNVLFKRYKKRTSNTEPTQDTQPEEDTGE